VEHRRGSVSQWAMTLMSRHQYRHIIALLAGGATFLPRTPRLPVVFHRLR